MNEKAKDNLAHGIILFLGLLFIVAFIVSWIYDPVDMAILTGSVVGFGALCWALFRVWE